MGKRTGSICLRLGTGGVLLWMRSWTFGYHKMRGICWLDEKLFASQEGLYTVELVHDCKPWRHEDSKIPNSQRLTENNTDDLLSCKINMINSIYTLIYVFVCANCWFYNNKSISLHGTNHVKILPQVSLFSYIHLCSDVWRLEYLTSKSQLTHHRLYFWNVRQHEYMSEQFIYREWRYAESRLEVQSGPFFTEKLNI